MNKMSTKHFMFFIIATCTISLRCYSSIFIRYGGRDTWIISIIASLIIFLYFLFLMHVCNSTNTCNFTEIIFNSLPRVLAKILIFIFSIGLFLSAIESASVESSSIHTNYFLSTPTWYCLIFFLIAASYVLNKKFNSILILIVITVSTVVIGDIILFILVAKYLNFSYLLPLLQNGFTTNKFICLAQIISSFSSLAICLPYLKYIDKKNSLLSDSSFAIGTSSLLVILSFIVILTLFGPVRGANIFYPEYTASQRVQIASFFEFGELFFIYRSICLLFLKFILSSYGIMILYKNRIKRKHVFISVYVIIIFTLSYFLNRNQFFLFDTLNILQFITGTIYLTIPLLTFCIYYFSHKVKS